MISEPTRLNMDGLQRGMDAAELDVLIAVSPDNFFYLADTLNLSQKIIPDRLSMAVLPRGGESAIVDVYHYVPQGFVKHQSVCRILCTTRMCHSG
ncbi:hypothetical protein KFU94_67450 [Chloroflexi bacterium TSY]|nr:hypothetical protein [Chloroflexi bacterium TSY]